jgi:hypothetical protein
MIVTNGPTCLHIIELREALKSIQIQMPQALQSQQGCYAILPDYVKSLLFPEVLSVINSRGPAAENTPARTGSRYTMVGLSG